MATYTINEALNGIEISFNCKPARETLDTLKKSGFRWHNVKKLWYAKNTPERLETVKAIADGEAAESKPAKADRQAELKALYMDIIKNEVWPGSEHMQDYERKSLAYVVELSTGNIIAFDKPTIQKDFCFGYGYYGVSTDDDDRRAAEMADYAATNESYFKEQNLKELNDKIAELHNCLIGESECYTFTAYTGQADKSKLKTYTVSRPWKNPDNEPSLWANYKDVEKLNSDDVRRIINGLEEVKKSFEKRLDNYLKKYGLSKINTWTYLRD